MCDAGVLRFSKVRRLKVSAVECRVSKDDVIKVRIYFLNIEQGISIFDFRIFDI